MICQYVGIFTKFSVVIAFVVLGSLATPVQAEPPVDPNGTITFQIENDSTNPGSDQYYTNGLRLAYTSPTDPFSGKIADLGHAILGAGQQRFSMDLSQLIFTAHFTGDVNPPYFDRPYAGLLIGSFSLITDTDRTRTTLGLGLGLIGPAALGEQVQNGWHAIIGNDQVRGWGTQMTNQPVIQITGDRIWRLPVTTLGPMEVDVLPEVTAAAGTFRIFGQLGGQVRVGQGLTSDFGVPRIRPGMSGTDAYVQVRDPISWYVFFGADGQAVAWDETLDGLPFAPSRHVGRVPFVGEMQAGFSLLIGGIRITASQVVQTAEFRTQRPGLFQFSSVSLSFKF